MSTPFRELAELCEKLEKLTERIPKISMISAFLKKLSKDELAPAVRLIIGKIFPDWSQYTLEISWATIIKIVQELTKASPKELLEAFNKTGDPGEMVELIMKNKKVIRQATLFEEPLTILNVYRTLESIAKIRGSGSRVRKEAIVKSLLSRASPLEAKYLVKIMLGEMRHGVSEGLMEEAIAKAADVSLELVERAHMFLGDIGEVAYIALTQGAKGLENVHLQLFRPLKPMLAQQAERVQEALREHGGKTAFEYKFDGARVQIHVKDGEVKIFSRRLTDVTKSLPDVVEIVKKGLRAREAVVEGEVVAIGENDKPLPFQHLMRRFRRVREISKMIHEIPVKLYLFDILYLDGELLIDSPYVKRREILSKVVNGIPLTPQIITDDPRIAENFLEKAINEGHEGLMAKKLDSKYTPGIRGKLWLKIKPVLTTLDLVIVAADWGYGRRKNWLSDYYLAARDEKTGKFLVVGKTFKGLTDEEFEEMTRRLLQLKIGERGRTVYVRPEIVVEVAFNEIQKSPKYKSGYALRFARIVRIRDDKSPEEADTIQRIEELYKKQFLAKAEVRRDENLLQRNNYQK
ncbi:MAG: ATP-dependent DNA ligase [Candidatus Njordarchaeales archaeon]